MRKRKQNTRLDPTGNKPGRFCITLVAPAAQPFRVCRTWHRTNGVEVPVPGRSRAEGKEKGKGYIVRCGLEEAQSESARRRTGIGYEVWHTQDELARDNEVLHLRKGVLYKSGVYAWKVLCLTPGDLFAEQ